MPDLSLRKKKFCAKQGCVKSNRVKKMPNHDGGWAFLCKALLRCVIVSSFSNYFKCNAVRVFCRWNNRIIWCA